MRLVAGSNPATRTINHQHKGKQMGYHDRMPPSYSKTGIGVVNPLIRIERKLKQIQEVLDNISEASVLTANDLKSKLEKVINED